MTALVPLSLIICPLELNCVIVLGVLPFQGHGEPQKLKKVCDRIILG